MARRTRQARRLVAPPPPPWAWTAVPLRSSSCSPPSASSPATFVPSEHGKKIDRSGHAGASVSRGAVTPLPKPRPGAGAAGWRGCHRPRLWVGCAAPRRGAHRRGAPAPAPARAVGIDRLHARRRWRDSPCAAFSVRLQRRMGEQRGRRWPRPCFLRAAVAAASGQGESLGWARCGFCLRPSSSPSCCGRPAEVRGAAARWRTTGGGIRRSAGLSHRRDHGCRQLVVPGSANVWAGRAVRRDRKSVV